MRNPHPISIIVPTCGRETLRATLRSIDQRLNDEWIIVGDGPQPEALAICAEAQAMGIHLRWSQTAVATRNYGHAQRRLGMALAQNPHLLFMDDDDVYTLGAREIINRCIESAPDRPTFCRIKDRNGAVLWHVPMLRLGNVSTQMLIVPNDPTRMGQWENGTPGTRGGDYHFFSTLDWNINEFVWCTDVICLMRPIGPWNDREFFYGR